MKQPIVTINNLCKSYDGNVVLKDVSMAMRSGTIHGLLGLNGAGKSTLVKILSGMVQPDSGEIFIDGKSVCLKSPLHAKKAGVVTIHQNIPIDQSISVAEYMYMNISVVDKREFHFCPLAQMQAKSRDIFRSLKMDIDPSLPVKALSIGQRQLMHIAISIALKPKALLLDEPYSMLSPIETEALTAMFKELRDRGMAILMVTHEMSDAINNCDEISILKDGTLTEFLNVNASREELIEAITDKNQMYSYPYIEKKTGKTILKAEHISTKKLDDVSFSLKKGEILGIAGLLGAGKTSLARTLFGVYPLRSGRIVLNGSALKLKNPSDAIKNKICLMPEDLMHEGVIESFSVKNNISLPNLKDVSRFRLLNHAKERRVANSFIKRYVIRTRSAAEPTRNLSAGNKQKLSISKWIFSESAVLIMDDPTSTVDIASKVEIYNFMNKYCLEGGSIIFISSDFDELMGMCDRILLMRSGKITRTLSRRDYSDDTIIGELSK